MSAGGLFTCALLQDQTVQCWGNNEHGQLGNGTTANSAVPVTVLGITTTAKSVTSGGFHACARLSDDTARCWGGNQYGALGNATNVDSTTAVSVSGLSSVAGVSAGAIHSCAVLLDGTARCWGVNAVGEFGDGTTSDSNVPTAVYGIATATQISAGDYNTCATLANGTIQCWGDSLYGALGNGTTEDVVWDTPVNVSNITTATAVSSAFGHSCALLSDGTVQCWGWNGDGELGNGTAGQASGVPVVVEFITTVTKIQGIEVGANHSCAWSASAVSCWGQNNVGQLGDGFNLSRYLPEPVHFF